MQRTYASAGLAILGPVLAFVICGCGSNPSPVTPAGPSERAYHFEIEPATGYANPVVEARTTDSTYRAVTNGAGAATLRIANEARLPGRLVFTIDGAAITPTAALAPTDAGTERTLRIHCDGRPGTVLVRAPSLHHLGDQFGDEAADDYQLAPEGAQLVLPFTLLAIPQRMPSYRLAVRGLQAYVELRVNGHLVSRLRPPTDPTDLAVEADTLLGIPANVFELTQNVLTIKTVGLPTNSANLDNIELGAVMLYFP
jgi:hypothetical protein